MTIDEAEAVLRGYAVEGQSLFTLAEAREAADLVIGTLPEALRADARIMRDTLVWVDDAKATNPRIAAYDALAAERIGVEKSIMRKMAAMTPETSPDYLRVIQVLLEQVMGMTDQLHAMQEAAPEEIGEYLARSRAGWDARSRLMDTIALAQHRATIPVFRP